MGKEHKKHKMRKMVLLLGPLVLLVFLPSSLLTSTPVRAAATTHPSFVRSYVAVPDALVRDAEQ